jgi:hypothetical protein
MRKSLRFEVTARTRESHEANSRTLPALIRQLIAAGYTVSVRVKEPPKSRA